MRTKSLIKSFKNILPLLIGILFLSSCEKNLDQKSFDKFSSSSFFKNADDAKAAVTAMYAGMMGGKGAWQGGYGAANGSWHVQSSFTTDELVCSWGWQGWKRFNELNLTEDFGELSGIYAQMMPIISEITIDMDKINGIDMNADLKKRYIGELTALRAHYSQILYNLYGPVPIRVDAKLAADPKSPPIPRPTKEWMAGQIEKDFKDAVAVLPNAYSADDFGRYTKGAALTGLMKLYMQEKRWTDAIATGNQIKAIGYSLITNYADNFNMAAKTGNSEIILAIPCRKDAWPNTNMWLAHALPGNYVDPTIALTEWGGYKMPWATYNKFDTSDKRLSVLLQKYPTYGGATFDTKANGYIGAIPVKYGIDPTATGESHGINWVVWRYADVELLLAEAINEVSGPTQQAIDFVKDVRNRAGLATTYTPGSVTKDEFRKKIQDERLFELWCESVRKDDLVRWGTYIQRVKDAGSIYAKDEFILYPLPRKVINETNGVVKQNPGY
jgi:hypothetical protein